MSTLTDDFINNLNNLNKFIATCINAVYVLCANCFAISIIISLNFGDNTNGDNPFELIINRGVINSPQSQLFEYCQNTQDYTLSFEFDNLQNSNNISNLTKNKKLLTNDKNGQFWFLLQNININVTENQKSKKHKTRSKKEITIDDTKEIFNKNGVVSYINKLSQKDASWNSEILKRTTNVNYV